MFSTAKTKKAPAAPLDLLKKALQFTGGDLKANRAGVITEAQRERITRRETMGGSEVLVTASFAVVIVVVTLIYLVPAGRTSEGLLLLVMMAGGAIVPVYRRLRSRPDHKTDLRHGRVRQVTGVVYRRIYRGRGDRFHEIRIGEECFRLNRTFYNAFSDYGSYTIYYVADSDTLLSAEPVEL